MVLGLFLAVVISAPAPSPSPAREVRCPHFVASPSAPPASPTPTPWQCESWVAFAPSIVHAQNNPGGVASAPAPVLPVQIDAGLGLASGLALHVSGFDRMPGAIGSTITSLSQLAPLDATYTIKVNCMLCRTLTQHMENLATQANIQPGNLPNNVPTNANLFTSILDLTTVAPANVSADVAWNFALTSQPTIPTALAGVARGTTPTGTMFDDGFLILQTPLSGDGRLQGSIAQTVTNHVTPAMPATNAVPAMAAVSTHASDSVLTLATTPGKDAWSSPITLQFGTQATAAGQTINVMQQYQHSAKHDVPNEWNLLLNGDIGDFDLLTSYVSRGVNFAPPDQASADALPGLHGFASDANAFLPIGKANGEPLSLDLNGYSYSDALPRYRNLAAALTVPLSLSLATCTPRPVYMTGIVLKASRGFIAANQASSAVATTALPDSLGGTALIPQSAVEADLAAAGGTFSTSQGYSGVRWSLSAGLATRWTAECNVLGIASPCASVHHNQFTLNTFVDSPIAFVSASLGPATLSTGIFATANDSDAPTPHSGPGGFVNKSGWNIAGAFQPIALANDTCARIMLTASNTVPPPDVFSTLPGTSLNISGFVELASPSRAPFSIFAGAAHTIQNLSTPTFQMPGSFASNIVSTVTYAVKLSFGSERYRYHLQRNCPAA
jgi:hypothetical protein